MRIILMMLMVLPVLAYAGASYCPLPPKPKPHHETYHPVVHQKPSVKVDVAASNEVAQTLSIESPKQAPSVGQGSIFIPECGAGGNGGGSNSSGSAFLGFAYVPAWCQDFKYAAWLWSVGDYEGACRVMAESKVGKRAAKHGIPAPKCVPPEQKTSNVTQEQLEVAFKEAIKK